MRATKQRAASYRYGNLAAAHMAAIIQFGMLAAATAYTSSATVNPAFAYYSQVSDCDDDLLAFQQGILALNATVTVTAELGGVQIPKTFRQAMRSPQSSYWREAIAKELGGLLALHTWEMVLESSMPPGSNLMHCHYVFTVKRKADGSIEKFKARLVADGNTQKHGVDFDRIFSTVVKTTTIRLVLAIAAARDYNLTSIDIRQAYL